MAGRQLCDRTIALAVRSGRRGHLSLVLVATILASSLDFIDGSAVNVGLPAIGQALHGQAADLQWVVNGYLLPLSALLLTGGSLGDRFGRRRVLTFGVCLFAASSLAAALAPKLDWLIFARCLQGVAAAMMLPNSLAVLGNAFDVSQRNRAVGLWAASGAIAAAIGPLLGGWLIDTVGWRAIFLINLPLAAGAAALTLFAVDVDGPAPADAQLDLAGAAVVTLALSALIWGLTQGAGPRGWGAAPALALAAGGALAATFLWIEGRLGDRAMAPLAMFGSRPLAALNSFTFLLYGALAGFMLLLPYLLITRIGYSAAAAGVALLPFPIIMGVGSPIVGALASHIGARTPLVIGAIFVAAGCLLTILAPNAGGYWVSVLPSVAVMAIGMSFAAAPLTSAVLGAVDARHTGVASGMNSAVAQLGGVVAIALIGGVLARRGAAFTEAFDLAALVGAAAAILAGAIAAVFSATTGSASAPTADKSA